MPGKQRCGDQRMHVAHYWLSGGLLSFDGNTFHCPGVAASDPERVLTTDEVAKRIERALLRAVRVLYDVRDTPGLLESVTHSRHWPNGLLEGLAEEVAAWQADITKGRTSD